jgi:hypothetical protein
MDGLYCCGFYDRRDHHCSLLARLNNLPELMIVLMPSPSIITNVEGYAHYARVFIVAMHMLCSRGIKATCNPSLA